MKLRVCLIVAGQMLADAAAADPYPFSGFYALERPGFGSAACAFDILHQSESGEFSGYLLDKRHWNTQKRARFLRYKHGACTFDASTAIDNCVTHVNHVTDVREAKLDRAKVTVLSAHRVAMLTLGDGDSAERLPDLPPFVFKRCPFDADQIAPLLSDDVGGYSRAELREMASVRDADLLKQVLGSITQVEPAVD
ncbi:hypothetical protein [Hyphomicrobium sp. CS1GBMeth3]|uniref:hypothetical protein n=1 Tax=Hyphomicrobium sp. CS1GBMeth3 TaxID=1892845 RepID=UPI00092FE78D|nr:hypothetical protein [Hyphomicrobium sp. CS1GBMeth3]